MTSGNHHENFDQMKNLQLFSLLTLLGLLHVPNASAIWGGPWDSIDSPSSAIGTYSASMRGPDTIGFMVFSYSPDAVPTGYVAIFSGGNGTYALASGYVDKGKNEIIGVFGEGGFVATDSGSPVIGSWEGKFKNSSNSSTSVANPRFEGSGIASSRTLVLLREVDADGKVTFVEAYQSRQFPISVSGLKSSSAIGVFNIAGDGGGA